MKYFVSFYAENNDNVPTSDVIEWDSPISSRDDIRAIEEKLLDIWFGDDREVVLLNITKL